MLAQASHAAIITIANLDPTDNFMSGGFTTTVTGTTPRNIAFAGTFDMDGGGTNDTLTFDITYEYYSGSSYSGTDVTLGTPSAANINNQNWGNPTFTGGDTLALLVSNIAYSSGEADGTTVVFDGYTGIRKIDNGAGAVDFAIGGLTGATVVTGPAGNGDLNISSLGNATQLYITSETGNGSVRLRDLDLQFSTVTAVPEPSSFALLGVLGCFAASRRRRLTKSAG